MKNLNLNKILVIVTLLAGLFFITACDPDSGGNDKTEKYTVIFNVNAGNEVIQNEPAVVRVDSGTAVSRPTPDPIRNGYDFIDWYDNENGEGQAYDFTKAVTSNNFTLYAIWEEKVLSHSITFDYQGAQESETVQIVDGEIVEAPIDPERENYRFDGWYIDSNFGSKYNFTSSVDSQFTLYAKWIKQISITFNFNYTSAPSPIVQTVDKNVSPSRPTPPTRDNFIFSGWFIDNEGTTAYDFTEAISNLTVYAKWVEDKGESYTVVFDYNYEGKPTDVSQVVPEGGVVDQPVTIRENYRFLGWYLDNNTFTQKFNVNTPISKDLVLYANWVSQYKLTYNFNYEGHSDPTVVLVDGGSSITALIPSRIGYKFAGWSTVQKGSVDFDFEEGISENTVAYAQWSKVNIFEAEYLDFDDFFGWGFSGNATGTGAILEDVSGQANASNGRFVTFLYGEGITLDYTIYSDRDVDNVKLTLRLSAEIKDIIIQSEKGGPNDPTYTIKVNGESIDYGWMDFNGVPTQGSGKILPFEDFLISTTVNLKAGENKILLITDNSLLMGGTMQATAPMVDCIKLETYAILTWDPRLDNY